MNTPTKHLMLGTCVCVCVCVCVYFKWKFLQKLHTDIQKLHEETLIITQYWENITQTTRFCSVSIWMAIFKKHNTCERGKKIDARFSAAENK